MSGELITHQPSEEHQLPEFHRLVPLLDNKPVALAVSDTRIVKKDRQQGRDPLLFISPLSSFANVGEGIEDLDRFLVFALDCNGCEIVKVDDLNAARLYRVGLSMRTAKMLMAAIKALYGVQADGEKEGK